mmetsp:Transcript_24489/g.52975  ORF Transcript_24489/g.52975 Transcript_24489/m.52975 type:complete len:171 (+) Transcript_24489:102-614(+)
MKVFSAIFLISLATLSRAFVPLVPQTLRPTVALSANPIDTLFAVLKEGKVGLVKSLAGEYDAPAIRTKIDNLVEESPVLLMSFTTCPFCIEAKGVLDSKGAKYTVVELDEEEDGKAIRAEMGGMLGRTSVPAIWIDGTFIGGCNDGPLGGVNGLQKEGRLDGMLKAAGAM